MVRLKVVLVALVILPGFVSGQQSPLSHTVVKGETLWGLAQRYYQDPFLWPRIWQANRAAVEDPNLIFPTQVFVIPGMEGPAVVSAVEVQPSPRPGMAEPEPEPEPVFEGDTRTRDRTVFYRDPDTGAGVALTSGPKRVAVPRHTVYSAKWLVSDGDDVRSLGTVDSFMESGDLRTAFPYTRVQIGMHRGHELAIGDRLQSFRPGRVIDGVGRVMSPTSVLSVTRVEEAGIVAVVLDAFDRVRGGDMVRPAPPFDLEPGEEPDLITEGGTARILGFGEDRSVYSIGNIAFLDQGEAQGLEVGDEYILYTGDTDGWSGDVAGSLQVVGTRPNTASARIIRITSPVFTAGLTVHLDRKMR
ncbi:MAG: hypothetical protein BMS9Abin29_1489 [Gemmatimonadota bacterium]|nr:MAG: hypothetical protein BMS9Abin29_1489 [Gemmatimonadota bacterium]